MRNMTAYQFYLHYRKKTEQSIYQYNESVYSFPAASFPNLAARVWRLGILSELWGTIDHKLNPHRNVLRDWGEGR